MFIGRTDDEAETPILWPPHTKKSWLIAKDFDAGKDWGQEEKGKTEDDTVGWYHQLSEHEFEQTPGDGERQGNLACCSPQGHKGQYLPTEQQQQQEGRIKHKFYKVSVTLRQNISWLTTNKFK